MSQVYVDTLTKGGMFDHNGRLNFGAMRPFYDPKTDRSYITVYKGRGDVKDPSNWETRPINTNATLRRDEWKQLDAALIEAARFRLGGVEDLVSNGLVYTLGNAMGTTVLEWHDVSDGMEAIMDMDPVTRGPNDRPKYQYNYLPIPIIHVDFELNARELAVSRNLGNPLDTTVLEQAVRRIQEKMEANLFTDTTYSWGTTDERGRNTIYSYLNFPDRNTVNLSIPWDSSAITGPLILQDVLEMIQASVNARHYGPWMLYIPTSYQIALSDDYTSGYPKTVMARLLEIPGLKGVKVIDTLPDDNVLLVEMRQETVRLVKGMDIQVVEWGVEGNFITKYKVMTIQIPQIRSDQNGRCGIVHMS